MMNPFGTSLAAQPAIPTQAPMQTQAQPPVQTQAPMQPAGGFPQPGQGMPNFNPLSGMGEIDAAPSGGNDYLGNGMYILMLNLAKFKPSRAGVPLYIVEAQVVGAVESATHLPGMPASWTPKLDSYGKKDIKQFLGAAVLGLDVRRDLERVNREVSDPILQASITTRADGQPALAGRCVAVTVREVPQKRDPNKMFSKHFWHPVSEQELEQAKAAGGFSPEAVARICRGV